MKDRNLKIKIFNCTFNHIKKSERWDNYFGHTEDLDFFENKINEFCCNHDVIDIKSNIINTTYSSQATSSMSFCPTESKLIIIITYYENC